MSRDLTFVKAEDDALFKIIIKVLEKIETFLINMELESFHSGSTFKYRAELSDVRNLIDKIKRRK